MAHQETIAGDLGDLLDAGDGAIVTLVAGDTQLVAHRKVLEARSPVFKSKFSEKTHEANNGRIVVTDVEGPVLRQLVAYCYNLQAIQVLSMAPQLLEASEKYSLSGLKDAYEQQIVPVRLDALLDVGHGAIVTLVDQERRLVAGKTQWVPGKTRLAVHRAVLEAKSPGFKSLIGGNSSGEIPVKKVEGPVLRQLVAYCYTLQAPKLPSMAFQLLAPAHKYQLTHLKDACEQQVVAQLAVETAATLGVLALRCSCPTLKRVAVPFIKVHSDQVVRTQGWEDAVDEYPHHLLELTRLILESPAETRDHSSTPATATEPTGRQHTPPPDDTAISHMWPPATATPGTHCQPHSGHGCQPTAAVATPKAPCNTAPPPADAALSRFRSLSESERGRKLIQAAKQGAVKELWLLLAAGADMEAKDGSGLSALHWAAFEGHVDVVRTLMEFGADSGVRTSGQDTPLHFAVLGSQLAVVRLLLANSADPNARNQHGRTPLHLAAWWGHTDVVAALLQAGADAALRDDDGKTSRDYIKLYNGRQHIVMLP